MTPNTLHHSRKSVLIVSFAVLVLTLLSLQAGETSAVVQIPPMLVYCAADAGAVFYVSPIVDTKLRVVTFSSHVIAREFGEFLKGKYGDTGPGFRGGCPVFGRTIDAETSKRNLEAKARQAGQQVVEVEWRYVVDPDYVAAAISGSDEDVVAAVANKRKPTHTYCLADSGQGTLYTTGPVETGQAVNLSYWNRGFDQFLKQKYAFKAQIFCNIASSQETGRLMAARIAGARAAGKKIVDTGWKYDPNVAATNNPAPAKRDDDPEPVQRPAAPNPSRQASDAAIKEMPAAVTYCQKDPSMSVIFICDSFGRSVYNYRMAHVNEVAEPLVSIVPKLNCVECVDPTRVSSWIEKHAAADKLGNKAINCVTQNVVINLQKTPQASRLNEFYKEAVATCNR